MAEHNPEVDGYITAWENEQERLRQTPGTVEWARTVELPSRWLFWKHLGALAAEGAVFQAPKTRPLFPQYTTRGDLIRAAEQHQMRTELLEGLARFSEEAGRYAQAVQDLIAEDEPKFE